MDPFSHFLIGLVPLLLLSVWYKRLPDGETLLVLFFATQLPDIIDKPLAWTFGILPSGRMLAHSLLIGLPLVACVVLVAHRRGRASLGYVFAYGYLSHLAADFYPVLFLGSEYYFFPNMFWPLLPANPDQNTSFFHHVPPPDVATVAAVVFISLVLAYSVVDVYRKRNASRRETSSDYGD